MSLTARASRTLSTPEHLRPAGVAGLGAVAAMVTAFLLLPADDGGTAPAEIGARYADGSAGYLRASVLETLSVALSLVLVAGVSLHLVGHHSRLTGAVAAVGGAVLLTCQLIGYGLVATLAVGTASRGDEAVVLAVYDASAVMFVVANAGLLLLAAATAVALRRTRRAVAVTSALIAIAALLAACSFRTEGALSPHGDLGFAVLLLQLLWTVVVSVELLRRR